VLYLGVPLVAWLAGVALHLSSAALFWRVLSYAAVFHFIRQQYGWVMLYRRRAGETSRLGRLVDGAAVYAAAVYPMIHWHASPPRRFHWFVAGDFVRGLPPSAARAAFVVYAVILVIYAGRALFQGARRGFIPWGKHLVVASTAVCWWLGIVAFDSDYVFTVTNVLIHGVPYFVLVHRYGAHRFADAEGPTAAVFRAGVPAFYAVLVAVAFFEEGLWDALVWHDHPGFFGSWDVSPGHVVLALIVPLLTLPQAVHYALDAFIWKVGPRNPGLARNLSLG